MIKVVMFDLDGTLLPMDQEKFVNEYFSGLGKKLAPYGYDPQAVVGAVFQGVKAMVKNDGSKTNEEVFWEKFSEILGEEIVTYKWLFEDYYNNEFQQVQKVCGFASEAKQAVNIVKNKGLRCVLATSPMFPKFATESRMKWAGFETSDFEIYSTYEDYNYCKPNLNYYRQILSKINVSPEECLMVGNDVKEDMVAKELGFDVFLLTDCMINREQKDISEFNNGGFDKLIEYLKNL